MFKVIIFGVLMNFFMFFTICPKNIGINILFTIGLLAVLFDSLRDKVRGKRD